MNEYRHNKKRHFHEWKGGSEDNSVILDVKDLSVEYLSNGKTVNAVNNVSFQMRRGEALAIVGESGCGKSTIAKAVLRILPDRSARISAGEINYKDMDLAKLSDREMRSVRGSDIAMIFQDPMSALNPVKRIITQISGVIRLHNPQMSRAEVKKRAMHMLKVVGILPERARDYPHQFSGGMQQRVEVAIGLSCEPDMLIADEPTTALDVTMQAQVLDMILDLVHKRNTALLLITHNLGIVAETCDNVAVLYGGEIVEYGSRDEIFRHPTHPYTIGLFGALPNMKSPDEPLKPIEGIMPEPSNLPEGCKFNTRCPYAQDICRAGNVPVTDLGGTHICRCHRLAEVEQEAGK